MFMMLVCGAVIYYGWPVIEAILIMLPIPDPKMLKDRIIDYASRGWAFLMGLIGRGGPSQKDGYQQDFENSNPNTFMNGDDDDEEDDDSQDVGKKFEDTLNYDSDEKDTDGKEMINLEDMPKQQKEVPKIRKPKNKK